ncbi:MAG: NusA-like transcription termination signal-binding factor [Candidatus Diapherotrites archaeon]|nr:NusA-like transcription termination signal-binding factor [Candidatus Diapherotrites archaeon]
MKLSEFEVQQLAFVSKTTGVMPKDVVDLSDKVVIIVKPGDLGRTIGKGARNIRQLEKGIGKHIIVVEHSTELNAFLTNILRPVAIKKLTLVSGTVNLTLGTSSKFKVGRKKIDLLKTLLKRHFDVVDVKVVFN